MVSFRQLYRRLPIGEEVKPEIRSKSTCHTHDASPASLLLLKRSIPAFANSPGRFLHRCSIPCTLG